MIPTLFPSTYVPSVGDNLVPNASTYSGWGGYSPSGVAEDGWRVEDAADRVVSITCTTDGEYCLGSTVSAMHLQAGQTYTMSAYLKSNGFVSSADFLLFDLNWGAAQGITVATDLSEEWKPYTWTVTVASSAINLDWYVRIDNNGSSVQGQTGILYIKDVKLEEGSSATGFVIAYPEHGIVDLIDCVECYSEHTEDEGSEWEIAFTYPCNGQGVDELQLDAIVLAKANAYQKPQAFRIYSVEHKTDKILTVKAQHISYDMANTPVKPFTATSPSDAVTKLRTNTIYGSNWQQHHFFISTDLTSTDEFKFDTPTSMRSVLLDGDNSIQGTYGGDLVFDNYDVQLLQLGGADRGVSIDYGVDLVDMTQEKNNSEMITGILPYYKRTESDELYPTDPIMYGDVAYGPGTYDIQKIKPVDLSEHFPNAAPTLAELNAKAAAWVAAEEIGIPEISLTVSYAHLGQDVRMHDAIRVNFPAMNVDTKAKVVKEKYNVLLEICEEIEVGHAKTSAMFNLMDASRLRKGLIPPERVADNSITSEKYARGSVGKGAIAPASVGQYEIEPYSINEELIAEKGIGGFNIKPDAVDTDHIKNEAVASGKLGKKAVTKEKIGDKAVGTDQVDDGAVTEVKHANNSVSTRTVVNAAIAYAKLSSEMQGKITKIDNLEASIAYINRLFATSATIDRIAAVSIYCTALSSERTFASSYISVANYTYRNRYKFVDTDGNVRWALCQ